MHAEEAQTLVSAGLASSPIAVSRLRRGRQASGPTEPYALHDAFLVVLQLRKFGDQDLWVDGRRVVHSPFQTGSLSIYDLDRLWIADMRDPFDCLQFHVPQAALDVLGDELGGKGRPRLFLPPQDSLVDPVVHQLGRLLLPSLGDAAPLARLYVDHLTLAFHAHLLGRYAQAGAPRQRTGARLAAWQEKRATDFLLAHIDEDVALEDVARECGVSRSQFIKSFKASTGLTPYRWLILQRLERAKLLIRASSMPLSEVALACGFVDQSHLTRHFSRHEGMGPAAWRSRRLG